MAENTIFGYCLLRIFGVYMYCFKPALAEKIVWNKFEISDVAAVLGKSELIKSFENDYPEPSDTVLAMFALGADSADVRFSFSEKELDRWKEAIANYFRSGIGGRRNNYFTIATEAIGIMKLSG